MVKSLLDVRRENIMNNIDEKIAKLRMMQRTKNAEKINEDAKNETEEEKSSILEDVIKQMVTGTVNINNNTFIFRKKEYLNGILAIPMPMNYFIEQLNEEKNITLVNDLHGVSFNAAYVDENVKKQKFSEFKEGMKQGFKTMKIYAEWLEEGSFGKEDNEKVYYASYKTPTAKGELYNFLFYRNYKGTMLIGNYNCFYKEIKIWEYLIKSSVLLMKVK